jgi:N-acetylglucosaminyl-diphospho-decaprenol L-rhamnosyltransferase
MELSIAVVTYCSKDLVEACLRSIRGTSGDIEHEVLVIDNRSSDGTVDHVRTSFPDVQLIENKHNVGLAKAVNLAFRQTSGRYFLFLNPDIRVHAGAITNLIIAMESDKAIGLCAPKLVNPDGSLQYSCRRYYTLGTLLLRRTFLGRMLPHHRAIRDHLMMDYDHATPREVDWVLGAAFLLRREAIQEQTVMDERFFLYFEDVDLCLRLRKAGWKVMYYPEAVMVHHHQRASARVIWNRAKFEHLKSWVKFSWKHRHEPLLRLSRNKFGH